MDFFLTHSYLEACNIFTKINLGQEILTCNKDACQTFSRQPVSGVTRIPVLV